MKKVVLGVALLAFVGVSAFGQDTQSYTGPATTLSQSTQKDEPDSKPTSEHKLVISPGSYRQLAPKTIQRGPEPFIVFVDPSTSSTLTTVKVEKHEADQPDSKEKSFHWTAAINQSLIFLGVQHGYALTQPKTRRDLKGPFFTDYARSVKSLHGWADGGRFFTNYIAHPMQGSFLGFIQIQNDPKGMNLRYNESGAYWRSRLKALAWSAAWSTQFEIGPVSQASIGNVGLHGKQTYIDIVMTPTAGFGWLVFEDFLDEHLVKLIERNSRSSSVRIASRTFLNPTRSVANLLRFKAPWYRDEGLR